jgi:hypothetical protein
MAECVFCAILRGDAPATFVIANQIRQPKSN